MLASLLISWAAMIRPDDADVTFLVVENDKMARSENVVRGFGHEHPGMPLHYMLEKRIGIPFARNRAVDYVVTSGHDLLLFVDDDETVDPLWLAHMIAEFRRSGALLIGGPVEALPPSGNLEGLSRILFEGIHRRYRCRAERAYRNSLRGDTRRTAVVTSNWLGHRDLFTRFGLRFDETMSESGGSDMKFSDDASRKGVSKSWANNAFVRELIPMERISFGYQFRRSRDQTIVSFQRKRDRSQIGAVLSDAVIIPIRALGICGLGLTLPFSGGQSLTTIARNAGWIAGRIAARLGTRSRLYENVTGD